jgi:hypothetical protein
MGELDINLVLLFLWDFRKSEMLMFTLDVRETFISNQLRERINSI